MRWLLANPLKTLPPLGLVAVGALVGTVGIPVLKKTARGLAVLTVKGALAVRNVVKDAGGVVNRGWEDLVEQAKAEQVKTAGRRPAEPAPVVEHISGGKET